MKTIFGLLFVVVIFNKWEKKKSSTNKNPRKTKQNQFNPTFLSFFLSFSTH